MKRTLTFVILALALSLAGVAGCSNDRAKLEEDQRFLKLTIQAQRDRLQWELDDATAVKVFKNDLNSYMFFRRCHELQSNGQKCQALMKRVSDAEARAEQQQKAEDKKVLQ